MLHPLLEITYQVAFGYLDRGLNVYRYITVMKLNASLTFDMSDILDFPRGQLSSVMVLRPLFHLSHTPEWLSSNDHD